jgi:hypothetical protein
VDGELASEKWVYGYGLLAVVDCTSDLHHYIVNEIFFFGVRKMPVSSRLKL